MSSTGTLDMTVDNIGFMLDQLGEDCAPLQFLRELTQNAIEALLKTPEAKGEIVWDVDWTRHTLTNVYKLAVIDTGVGMTGPEMVHYINQLSSSMHEQSMTGNFGVGAKIAAATRNRAGTHIPVMEKRRGLDDPFVARSRDRVLRTRAATGP